MYRIVSRSATETKKIASDLARDIIRAPRGRGARVVALSGGLGAGKTTFTQGFAAALGIKEKIKSPTFVLLKRYRLQALSYKLLFHLDCYRVRDHRDLQTLDIKGIFNNPSSIILIEWPEHIKKILPRRHTRVHLDHLAEKSRKIIVTYA